MTPPPSLPPTGEGLPEEIASDQDKIRITFERRPDGGLRVYSDELPGLVLSHAEHAAVLADLRPAIEGLLSGSLSAALARAERAEKDRKELYDLAEGAVFHFFCCGAGVYHTDECGQLVPAMADLAKAIDFYSNPAIAEEIDEVPVSSAVAARSSVAEEA